MSPLVAANQTLLAGIVGIALLSAVLLLVAYFVIVDLQGRLDEQEKLADRMTREWGAANRRALAAEHKLALLDPNASVQTPYVERTIELVGEERDAYIRTRFGGQS